MKKERSGPKRKDKMLKEKNDTKIKIYVKEEDIKGTPTQKQKK